MRRVIFWLHLTAGCVAGVVILVMSITGALLAFEEQIVAQAERVYRAPAPDPAAQRLPLATLAARAASGELPSAVTVEPDPRAPVRVAFGRQRTLLVQPFTGEVLGEGAGGLRKALRTLTSWHRWLGQSDESRKVGRAITGACNLAFLLLVLSGLYLWVPRVWSRRQVRNVAWFRRGLSSKARDFNWHNVLGLWAALPLVAIVGSGVVMSYPWANGLVYRLAGEEPPARRERGGPPRDGDPTPTAGDLAVLEAALAAAQRHASGWRSITLDLPDAADEMITADVARGGRGRPDLRQRLTIDPSARQVVAVDSFGDQSRGRRIRSWLRWIHTGEAGGILGQTIAVLASLAAAVLVWTGIALAWRRLVPRRPKAPVRNSPTDAMTGERFPRTDGGAP